MEKSCDLSNNGFSTCAVHAGYDPESSSTRAVVPAITMSSTFKQIKSDQSGKFEYGRTDNPSRAMLEETLAALDDGKYGVCFPSGLSAITATFLAVMKPGDHAICGDQLYGGSERLLKEIITNLHIELTFVDTTDFSKITAALQFNTKMVYFESPTNPLLKVTDIRRLSEWTKQNNILMAIDNTFLTSYFQRPLKLGADIVIYSLTKYMNGHLDVLMGAAVTNCNEIASRLKFVQNGAGLVPSPFDCSLVKRSLKTLALRMEQHMKNGLAFAKYLENHPGVDKVIHPGLPSHPQYDLQRAQTTGDCGMITFYIRANLNGINKFISALKLFTLAGSLGGPESLIEVPACLSHAMLTPEERNLKGIPDNLIRLSMGLEQIEDLINDFEQAFAKINVHKK